MDAVMVMAPTIYKNHNNPLDSEIQPQKVTGDSGKTPHQLVNV